MQNAQRKSSHENLPCNVGCPTLLVKVFASDKDTPAFGCNVGCPTSLVKEPQGTDIHYDGRTDGNVLE